MADTAVNTTTLRAVADIIDDAARVGLPHPQTVSIDWFSTPTIIMSEFDEVVAWAVYLGETPVESYTSSGGAVEHIATTSDQSDVYGISIKVTTNRPHVCEPVT